MVALRHVGTTAWLSEVLRMSVKTFVSSSAQSFRTQPGMLSGPNAFLALLLVSNVLTLTPTTQRGLLC